MAHFWRLILGVVFACVAWSSAHASIPTTYLYGWSHSGYGLSLPKVYSSADAACEAGVTLYKSHTGNTSAYTVFDGGDPGSSSAQCRVKLSSGGGWIGPIGYTNRGTGCPVGSSSIGGGQCECDTGFYEDAGQCKPVPDCGVGQYWNGSSCEPIPDPPLCNPPKVIIGDQCMLPPDPDDPCPPPNVLQPDGSCLPPCPSGLSRIDGVCKCPVGKVYVDGQCKDPECNHPLGTDLGYDGQQFTSANYGGGTFCHGSCVVYPSFAGRDPVSGKWFANGPLTSTGVACSGTSGSGGLPPGEDPTNPNPGDPPPPEEPPKSCAKGRCPGTVNGVTVCVPCSDTSSTSSGGSSPGGSIPGNGADGTGGPGQPGGPPGSSSTSTSTTCKDGKCTTTTTTNTTGEDGQAVDTKTETKEETKEDFCTENPKSPHCVEGSFGGSCEGGFTCEGDAVQCAIAQQQHLRMCKLFDDHSSAEAQLYESLKGKEGNQTGDLPGNVTFDFGPASIDTSSTIGASCIQDMNISVMGSSITIKLSSVCQYLEMLGNVLMALSFLLGARIVIRG